MAIRTKRPIQKSERRKYINYLFLQVSLHFRGDKYISWGKGTILVHLSVALLIPLPFMDGPHGQEQPLNGSLKLILSLK